MIFFLTKLIGLRKRWKDQAASEAELLFTGVSVDANEMSDRYRYNWVEEAVIFEERNGKQTPTPQSKNFVGARLTSRTAEWMILFLILVFLLIFFRLGYLQIWRGGEYRALAENNRKKIIPIPAERGLLFDANGEQLTKNIPNFYLALVPQDLPHDKQKKEQVINRLAELTNQTRESISQTIEEYGSYSHESVIIQENVDYNTALMILIESGNLPGIQIQRGSKRSYYNYNSADIWQSATSTSVSLSHLLGYIGKLNQAELNSLYKVGYLPSDYIGKTGIEKTYEKELRGVSGKKRVEVDASGKERAVLAEEAPLPGQQIYLTIDIELQKKLENTIIQVLKNNNLRRAVGIALDPNTGGVLAMVSLPAFDNNDFSGGIQFETYQKYLADETKPLFNRAISGLYPSGSTIKPAIASAALQEGIITDKTTFLSTGGLQIGDWFFPDWQAGGHGLTDVKKSLAYSVNTFYYYIGGGYKNFVGLGVDLISKYLRSFGFAQKLGIDLSGEEAGFLPSKEWKEKIRQERWYVGDTYNLSIGQGDFLVTPMQISIFTAAIGNGGTIWQPHLLKYFEDPLSKKQQEFIPKKINSSFIDAKNLQTVKSGMADCVKFGSCRRLSTLPFSVAGKTGTAQWSKSKNNHAWFTSFAPVDNPEIVLTILVEEGGEGSSIAAPIAYEFYKWWWGYKKNF